MIINCEGLRPADILVMLYNRAKVYQVVTRCTPFEISPEEASELLIHNSYIDSLYGKKIQVDFSTFPHLGTDGYDKYQCDDSMRKLINRLKIKNYVHIEPEQHLAPNVTYYGTSLNQVKIKLFDEVHFMSYFGNVLQDLDIGHPFDNFMYIGHTNLHNDKTPEETKYSFIGKSGGIIDISNTIPCIKNINPYKVPTIKST